MKTERQAKAYFPPPSPSDRDVTALFSRNRRSCCFPFPFKPEWRDNLLPSFMSTGRARVPPTKRASLPPLLLKACRCFGNFHFPPFSLSLLVEDSPRDRLSCDARSPDLSFCFPVRHFFFFLIRSRPISPTAMPPLPRGSTFYANCPLLLPPNRRIWNKRRRTPLFSFLHPSSE